MQNLTIINNMLDNIDEAVAMSYHSKDRRTNVGHAVAKKFKLTEFLGEKWRSGVYIMSFGPIRNNASPASGKYLHFEVDLNAKKSMVGVIKRYSVSSDPVPPRANEFTDLPDWVKKFEHAVGFATYAGQATPGSSLARDVSSTAPQYVVKKKDVNTRFKLMAQFLKMILNPETPVRSIVVHGTGGTGKTHTLKAVAKDMGFNEGSDYKILSGKITPTKLYEFMLENSDGMLIFDDIDSVLTHSDAENFIKAALDTTPPTIVTWNSPANKTGVMEFEFKGKIIFLTNLELESIAQPVRSRALPVNVTMTRDEVLDRIDGIIDKMNTDIPLDFKEEVWEFIKLKYKESGGIMPKEWNIRVVSTYFNAAWSFHITGLPWQDQVLSLMESGF